MKSTFKAGTLALVSLVTSVLAISSSALADDRMSPNGPLTLSTKLECNAYKIKEFTQVPNIKNITGKTIASGKVIYWQGYWAGKVSGAKQSITLTQPLAPGQSISTGVQLSGDSNSCKAYY
jgi:hypothetical protein